jgi:predicted nucleic acid-binding Zn finger protein
MRYDAGQPTEATHVKDRLYSVPSFRGNNTDYMVDLQAMTCTCPHFTERLAGTGETCKHLKNVLKQEIEGAMVEKARLCSDGNLERLLSQYQDKGRLDICGAIRLVQEERVRHQQMDSALKEMFR